MQDRAKPILRPRIRKHMNGCLGFQQFPVKTNVRKLFVLQQVQGRHVGRTISHLGYLKKR